MILAEINLSDMVWSIFVFFWFVIVLWMVFGIIGDIFRSEDLSGVSKTLWCLAILLVPWLAILVYLLVRGSGMAARSLRSSAAAQAQFDAYVRETAGSGGGAAGEITSAKELLDSGAISQDEFERIKAQALAGV